MTPHLSAAAFRATLKGSTAAHQALVRACCTLLAMHRWPACPIATTGIPVWSAARGFDLIPNQRQRGCPDIIAGIPAAVEPPYGRALLLECKTGKARQSCEQSEFEQRFSAAGYTYLVVREVGELATFMRSHAKGGQNGNARSER